MEPIAASHPTILTVPGLDGSGAGHWQTRWEASVPNCHRAELGDWDAPQRARWVARLDRAIREAAARSGRPVLLAAHSLGCLAVVWWAADRSDAGALVSGALLVAPPDADSRPPEDRIADFAGVPRRPLPFAATLVASRNDPYIALDAARALGLGWRCQLLDAGLKGHLNAASGLADWAEGLELLEGLRPNSPVLARTA